MICSAFVYFLLVHSPGCVPHPRWVAQAPGLCFPVYLWVCAWGQSSELFYLLRILVCFQQLVTEGKARDAGRKEARFMQLKTPESNERVRQINMYTMDFIEPDLLVWLSLPGKDLVKDPEKPSDVTLIQLSLQRTESRCLPLRAFFLSFVVVLLRYWAEGVSLLWRKASLSGPFCSQLYYEATFASSTSHAPFFLLDHWWRAEILPPEDT